MTTLSTFFDMVYVAATETSGHGPFTLGAALTGFQTAASAGITNGTPVSYRASDGANWETAHGVVDVSGSVYTLARGVDTIESSNSNALVNFGSGVTVLICPLSQDLNAFISAGAAQSFSLGQQAQAKANIGLSTGVASFNFKAGLTANQTIAASTTAKLTLNNVIANLGGYYDGVTNYRWTPPAAPVLIQAQTLAFSFDVSTDFVLRLLKNGETIPTNVVTQQLGYYVSSNSFEVASLSYSDVANGTDWYEIFVTNSSATTSLALNNNIANTSFSGLAFPVAVT